MSDLDTQRRINADALYEAYDFSCVVADAGGWQDDGLGELTKTVFFEPDVAGGDTIKGHFTVQFADSESAMPSDAYGMIAGQLAGKLADYCQEFTAAPAPR